MLSIIKKYLFLLCVNSTLLYSQSSSPNVVNSLGSSGTAGGITVHYSVGEPMIATASNTNNTVTQGFLQPNDIYVAGVFSAALFYGDVTCAQQTDGYILINTSFSTGNVSYSYSPAGPGDTLSSLNNLPAGTYTVTISDSLNTIIKTVTINPSTETCPITPPNSFSPNGDQLNDLFVISGIENYPKNHVYIYNRWGSLVWDGENYDNVKIVFDGKDSRNKDLSEGTYFYIILLDGKKSPYKHWLEITK